MATEFLKRHAARRLRGEINFISIAELLSDPGKKAPIEDAWIAKKAPNFSDKAKPALSLIHANTQGVQVRRSSWEMSLFLFLFGWFLFGLLFSLLFFFVTFFVKLLLYLYGCGDDGGGGCCG